MGWSTIDRYCSAVENLLICLPETRRELLKGLRAELVDLPPEQAESLGKMEVYYGKIPQTAAELQEAVSAEERAMALKRLRRKILLLRMTATILLFLLFAFYIFYYFSAPGTIIINPPNT